MFICHVDTSSLVIHVYTHKPQPVVIFVADLFIFYLKKNKIIKGKKEKEEEIVIQMRGKQKYKDKSIIQSLNIINYYLKKRNNNSNYYLFFREGKGREEKTVECL